MSNKIFRRIIVAVTVIGILSAVALTAYTVYLHENCSIIAFIANGG